MQNLYIYTFIYTLVKIKLEGSRGNIRTVGEKKRPLKKTVKVSALRSLRYVITDYLFPVPVLVPTAI